MAKMFYSLEEAAQRLGKTQDEVRAMAGQKVLTEFRDGDRLIFKVAEVDLLAPDTEDDGHAMIPLVDSSEQSSLGLADTGGKSGSGPSLSGTGTGIGAGKGGTGTGISVFDIGEVDETDPAAATMVTEEPLGNVNLESFGSGSGLMDLTRESDDTSLGAEGLLDDLYAGEEGGGGGGSPVTESGLFEGASAAGTLTDDDSPVASAAFVESLDPKWSGLAGGLSVGVVVAAALGLAFVMMGVMGAAPVQLTSMMGDMTILAAMGAMLVVALIGAGIGFFVGGK